MPSHGYFRSFEDQCVYFTRCGEDTTYLFLCVNNDMSIASQSMFRIIELKAELSKELIWKIWEKHKEFWIWRYSEIRRKECWDSLGHGTSRRSSLELAWRKLNRLTLHYALILSYRKNYFLHRMKTSDIRQTYLIVVLLVVSRMWWCARDQFWSMWVLWVSICPTQLMSMDKLWSGYSDILVALHQLVCCMME